jgi:hypothetical protein
MPKKPKAPDPDRLVRDQPGVYRSEDGRFTVRSDAAGAWYVGDGERTNELGLDLVLGPLATLAEAKELVRHQREAPSGQTPEEAAALAAKAPPLPERKPSDRAKPSKPEPDGKAAGGATASVPSARKLAPVPEPEPEPEPPKPAVYRPRRRRTGDDRDQVADVLQRINDAWLEGRVDEMAADLDEGVVFVHAGFAARLEGRKRAVDSLREFVGPRAVAEYSESDLTIDAWGDTAVATYRYEISWEPAAKRPGQVGRDLFVFRRAGGSWVAAYRLAAEGPDST